MKRILECVEGIEPREGLRQYIVLTMPLFTAGREALGHDRETVRKMIKELGEGLGWRNMWRSWSFWSADGRWVGSRQVCHFLGSIFKFGNLKTLMEL